MLESGPSIRSLEGHDNHYQEPDDPPRPDEALPLRIEPDAPGAVSGVRMTTSPPLAKLTTPKLDRVLTRSRLSC